MLIPYQFLTKPVLSVVQVIAAKPSSLKKPKGGKFPSSSFEDINEAFAALDLQAAGAGSKKSSWANKQYLRKTTLAVDTQVLFSSCTRYAPYVLVRARVKIKVRFFYLYSIYSSS